MISNVQTKGNFSHGSLGLEINSRESSTHSKKAPVLHGEGDFFLEVMLFFGYQ